jgi:hypothetical protein
MGSVALFFGILGFFVAIYGILLTIGVVPVMSNMEGMTVLVISIVFLLVGVVAGLLKGNPDY